VSGADQGSRSRRGPDASARRLAPLLRAARDAGEGHLPEPRQREQKERLLTSLAQQAAFGRARGAPSSRRRVAAGAAVGALALAAAVALFFLPRAPLGYTVHGAVADAGYVAAPAGAEATLRFSDGTRVTLSPGARGRVLDVDARGARLQLEGGAAHLAVVPGRDGRWSVEAGPFVVEVTGTEFDVQWTSAQQALEVVMQHGSVRVRGPLASGVELGAGQRLHADLARGEVSLGEARAPAAPTTSALAPPPPTPTDAPAPETTTAPAAEPRPEAKPPTWSARVGAGDFAGVVAEAEARGVDAVLDAAPLADLVALADAARYARRPDLARRTLQAQQARFPGSPQAQAAAFLLGRMAEDRGATVEAISLYDRYLAEAPGGAFAAEALGRKMVAVQRTAGRESARPIAQEYLRRFPEGAYAAAARDLTAP
jgi:ferric-dicitrate binding protein FerR (iron transport regulator)